MSFLVSAPSLFSSLSFFYFLNRHERPRWRSFLPNGLLDSIEGLRPHIGVVQFDIHHDIGMRAVRAGLVGVDLYDSGGGVARLGCCADQLLKRDNDLASHDGDVDGDLRIGGVPLA